MAIARTYDDQAERAELWGPRIGITYREEDQRASASWLAATLRARARRPAIDIGPSGAGIAADRILELLK